MFKIGKSEKGTVVHAINGSGKDNHALCDKRQNGLVLQADMDATGITCSKCLKYADVKAALAGLMANKPKSAEAFSAEDVKEQKDVGLAKQMPQSKKKKRGGKKAFPAEPLNPKPEEITPAPSPEEPEEVEEKVEEKDDGIIQDDGDFFAKVKDDGRFKIIHNPTGKSFFDSVPEEVVLDTVIKLNQIKERWKNVDSPLPDSYITNCRRALYDSYSENNKVIPKNLLDIEKKKTTKKSKLPPKSKTEKFKKGDTMVAVINGESIIMVYDGKGWASKKKKSEKKESAETTTPSDKRQRKTIKRRDKKEEKPKREIKRRDKKPEEKTKRVIKRRGREDTLLGRTKGSPGHTVLELLQKGVTMEKLLFILEDKHGLSKKKAWTKVRAVIRKTARRQNVPVTILMKTNPLEDIFQIAQLKKGS